MATAVLAPTTVGWETYAPGSGISHFEWWVEQYCVQSVEEFAGNPLELEPFQRQFMGEALAVDEFDNPMWKSCVLILPRKNGKTTLLAAAALYELLTSDGKPEILLAASSDKQAGRLFESVVSFVRQSPALMAQVHLREYIGEIARTDGMGKILRMSSSPERLHGYNPSLVIIDELAQWLTPSLRKAFAALTTGGGARKSSQTFTITTAGEAQNRKSSILGRLIDGNESRGEIVKPHDALTISRNIDGQTLVYNYSAATEDPHDLAAIKLANPASWITDEYLSRQASNPELTTAEFMQLHGCVWVEGANSWIKRADWDELMVEGADPGPGDRVYIGIDAAFTQDCSAIGMAWETEDGRIAVKSHVWSPRSDNPAHEYTYGRLDNRVMVPYLAEMQDAGIEIVEVVYDRRFLDTIALLLEEAGFMTADAWSSADFRAQAWKAIEDGIAHRTIVHNGDEVLATHVCNAEAVHQDSGIKVSKLANERSRKIDAFVAVAMAHWRAKVGAGETAWMGVW